MGRHDVFSDCLPVFEAAFADGKACDAMCSYNSIDSIPVSMDHELLTDVLRGQFGMPGFVRSDLTAVSRLYDWHFIAETPEEAIRLGLEAGVDLQLYDFPHDVWQKAIAHLIESGSMKMSVLDTACRRVLRMKFALGLFENPYTDEKRADTILRCPEHLATAEKIAEKSIVLLKNDACCRSEKTCAAWQSSVRQLIRFLTATIPKHAVVKAGFLCWTESVLQSAPKRGAV